MKSQAKSGGRHGGIFCLPSCAPFVEFQPSRHAGSLFLGPQGVDDLSMSTARGALTTGGVAATPPGEAPSAAEEGGKRWMLHYGRLLDRSCVAVAAAVDRCCYADVDQLRHTRTHGVHLHRCARTRSWRRAQAQWCPGTAVGNGSGREREEERRRPTPSSSPAEPGIQRSRPQRVSVVPGRRATA